ncbi:PREDICTED: 2S sulfur-rich seed storage protein 2-like [Theobroma cacao]|uniref:2S sulfur-rich seed storage protein 2-like n=1 Tax=Theobroma cacao TaxID=3641 RepID=A0AB32WJW7_THECC|nr:PREDICTED: 2S sulfur-rich seed storage protein 2-like [Theobroma cacao]
MEPRRCDTPSSTTITLDSEENTRGRQGTGCPQQIKKQNYLENCQKYSSCDNRSKKHLDFCCQQLEKMDRQCRCPGLKQAMPMPWSKAGNAATDGTRTIGGRRDVSDG